MHNQHVMKPLVVAAWKLHVVAALRFIVGRVTVKYRLRFFVFLNDALKIPILQHHVLQPAGGIPDLMKELADFFTRNGPIGKEEFIAEKRSIFLL